MTAIACTPEDFSSQRKALWACLAFSLSVHAALVVLWPVGEPAGAPGGRALKVILREGGGGPHPPAGHAGAGVERAFHIAERFAAASGETVPYADSSPKTADAVDDASVPARSSRARNHEPKRTQSARTVQAAAMVDPETRPTLRLVKQPPPEGEKGARPEMREKRVVA